MSFIVFKLLSREDSLKTKILTQKQQSSEVNNCKTISNRNAKLSRFLYYVEAISNACFFQLHDSTFKVLIAFFVFVEVHGYIASHSNTNKSQNGYIDVTMKTSKTESQLIRIMKSSNPMICMDYLIGFKQVTQPVFLFLNFYRGGRVTISKQVQFTFEKKLHIPIDEICQKTTETFDVITCIKWLREKALIQISGGNPVYVREGVLCDTTGHIILPVWCDMTDIIEEENLYCFTKVFIENYLGRTLTTTKMSVATVHKSSQDFPALDEAVFKSYLDKDQEIKKMTNPKLYCPKLLNIELDVSLGCTKNLAKLLNLLPGAKIVTCHHCSCTMRVDKCSCVFYCVMSFEYKMLTLSVEVVSVFLKEDIINMCQPDIGTFKEKLLFLESFYYIYNSKNIITAMEHH